MEEALGLESPSRKQVQSVTGIVRDVLEDAAIAAYLFGSAVVGGLRRDSDIDIFAVTSRSLMTDERAELIRRLLPLSGRHATDGPARSIELTIIARNAVLPWRYPPSLELQYGDWLRAEFERGDLPDWPQPDPDIAILIETVRLASLPLFGPSASEVFPPVPPQDLVRALVDAVPVLMPGITDGDDRRNGLLTLARIWTTLETGEIRSKDAAADWVLPRLPASHRRVLAHARAAYVGEEPEDWRGLEAQVRPLVDFLVQRVHVGALEEV